MLDRAPDSPSARSDHQSLVGKVQQPPPNYLQRPSLSLDIYMTLLAEQ